jgi:PAS domain S-box-containing protein
MRLSPRTMGCIGGAFVAIIVGLSGYDIVRTYNATVENTGRELDTQARIIAEQTARSLQAVDVVLRHLQDQWKKGDLPPLSSREMHEYLARQGIGLVQIEGLVVVDSNGDSQANSLLFPPPTPRPSVVALPLFQHIRETRDTGLLLGTALRSDVDGEWVLPIARRLENRNGSFGGAVGARGKVAYFQQFYSDLKLEEGTRVALMHRNGTLIARHPAVEAAIGKRFPSFDEILATRDAMGDVPMRLVSPIDGADRFGALHLVPEYPLAVIVSRDASAALAPWRTQSFRAAARTLGLAVLAIILLVLLRRQIARLESSQERFALAVAGSDDGIWLYDFASRRAFASARARELSGLPPGPEVMPLDDWNAMLPLHPDDAECRIGARDAHMSGKAPAFEGEWRVRHADGSYRWVRVHGLCVRDASGRPIRMAGSISDIDARKRAEEGLRSSEEQYRGIFNAAADALVLRDPQARVVDVNPAFLQISGYSREEVVSGTRWIFALPETAELAREMHRRCLAGESVHFEMKARRKDGELIDIEMRAVPVQYRGQPHALGMARDITAQKRAEAVRARLEGQLLQAKKLEAIGTLAGGIAHDFNNILSATLGYGEMAQKQAPTGTALRRHIDAVVSAGMRAKSLVERILAFSRSGIGERVPVHVQSVVAEALDLAAAAFPAHVTVERDLAAGDATVMGDPTQIHQVVMNLCANGVQAMKSAGTLKVKLEVVEKRDTMAATSALAAGRYVRLRVRDTGSGIAPDVLERIFDPFFTTKAVGTGLGLSLVHGIVTDLGGGIDVESELGKGTALTVFLPLSDAVAARPGAEEAIAGGEGETILLVDDEESLVRLGEEVIAGLGYEPVGFSSSTAALEAFRAEPHRFHAVLSDEAMPEMTGSELARAIRAVRPDVPILLMSGFVTPALTARAEEIGIADVLAKPLVTRDIARGLDSVLHRRDKVAA